MLNPTAENLVMLLGICLLLVLPLRQTSPLPFLFVFPSIIPYRRSVKFVMNFPAFLTIKLRLGETSLQCNVLLNISTTFRWLTTYDKVFTIGAMAQT